MSDVNAQTSVTLLNLRLHFSNESTFVAVNYLVSSYSQPISMLSFNEAFNIQA